LACAGTEDVQSVESQKPEQRSYSWHAADQMGEEEQTVELAQLVELAHDSESEQSVEPVQSFEAKQVAEPVEAVESE
ncbi:hypothetical protein KSZ18_15490, partial [Alistipes finegoldii]|uniref:hypothetical protein n=1 Tax=Alistipes finegoldii TaxID=214856 RepID=UPI001C38A2F7